MTRRALYLPSLIIACFIAGHSANAAEDCDFDSKGVTTPVFASGVVKQFEWDRKKLEYRALLSDDSEIYVKYYACVHWGLSAEMTFIDWSGPDDGDKATRDAIEAVGHAVLPPRLSKAMEDELTKHKELPDGKDIDIPVSGITEFYISVKHIDVYTVVLISYYMS